MRHRVTVRMLVLLAGVIFASQWSLGAQPQAKRPLSYDVMDYWRSIQGTHLSRDGQWLAYALTAPGDDGELVVRNLKTGQDLRSPRGTGPVFTPDARFVVFTIVPTKADDERFKRSQGASNQGGSATAATAAGGNETPAGPSRNGIGIMSLPGGQVTTAEQMSTFRIPDESSTWLAYHKGRAGGRGAGRGARGGRGAGAEPPAAPAAATEPPAQGTTPAAGATGATPEKKKDPGSDLIVRNLTTGQETTIADVTDYAWDKTGASLAYTVSSADGTKDGAFLRRMSDGSSPRTARDADTVTLLSGKGHYKSLAFDTAGRQVAFLSDQKEYDNKVSPYRLCYWKAGDTAAVELVSGATRGMPAGMVVSDNFAPRFSDDGTRLLLGTAPPPAPPRDENAPAPIRVDLWSYRDPLIQPMQQVRASQERTRNYRAVMHLASQRFVQLAAPDLPTVDPGTDPIRALGTSDVPYAQEISWDSTYDDVYVVDIRNGQRRKVLEHHGGPAMLSPGANYVLYFDEAAGHWFTYHIADGTRVNLTERLPVKFFQEHHDTPSLPGAYGSAGWTDGDRSVLVYDQFDIWEIRPDGSGARMATSGEGRKQGLVFRYHSLDPEAKTISSTKPLLLSAVNDATRASGFYRVSLAAGAAPPEKLLMVDKQVGTPTKAKNADVVYFTEQRFDEFPDLWVSDTTFAKPEKVSSANPQQAEFVWGKAERISYINGDGKVLRALLIKPENFDPAKKYPLIAYIYEGLSNGLHGYRAPNVGTSINATRYVSHGYVVLEPDIDYETGFPGPSAMKCVIPAINTVVANGYIDPARIGIQGHSWGGYQITYMITQTNIFRAVEAGASVSNMISAYGGIRWGTGMVREFQYEKTQSRIGSTPWDAPLKFIENSPIFWITRIHTPYLTIHNDADDAVPWYQGIEFNTAMRRLGKEAYMFTYNGQPHGLRDRDDMKHWTVHMDEFFDHYLLGKPRPDWMDKGVPFLEKGSRDVSPLFKKPVVPPATGGKG